jgi:hypothetical protein
MRLDDNLSKKSLFFYFKLLFLIFYHWSFYLSIKDTVGAQRRKDPPTGEIIPSTPHLH